MSKKVGEYIIEDLIGSGAYSKVFKAHKLNDHTELYAIKMITKKILIYNMRKTLSKKMYKRLEREIEILQMLNHENIVKLKDLMVTDNHYYLIFEYCNGGDLTKYCNNKDGKLDEHTARHIIRQVVEGLNELYNNKAIHRDIKRNNIFLHHPTKNLMSPTIKLGDFGFARLITQMKDSEPSMGELTRVMSIVGTPLNMAPELLHDKEYSLKADIWSLGTVLYEILCGRPCYNKKHKKDLVKNVDKGVYKISKTSGVSAECIDFINNCLQLDDEQHIKWKEVRKHPFVSSEEYTNFDSMEFKGH